MPYIVPTGIAYPPTGDAVGTTHRSADRFGVAYPNYVIAAASTANPAPTTGQIWPRGNP